jgi:hypothetical protein
MTFYSKLIGVGITLFVLLSSHITSSSTLEDKITDIYANPSTTVENPDDPMITPMGVQFIRPFDYKSYNAYEKSFTMDPENGEMANLWIKNTSKNTIYAQVTAGSLSSLDVPIVKGTQKTIIIGGSAKKNVKVYVYSSTGHKIEMSISARQF